MWICLDMSYSVIIITQVWEISFDRYNDKKGKSGDILLKELKVRIFKRQYIRNTWTILSLREVPFKFIIYIFVSTLKQNQNTGVTK